MNEIRKENISIIGAGPAGLAVAGALTHLGKDYSIYEKELRVAPMWEKHYDRLCLHTVRDYSNLPYFPIPKKYPTYLTKNDVLDYMECYRSRFNINPHFGTEIIKINKKDSSWLIKTNKGEVLSKNVVLCSGINRVPKYPNWENLERDHPDIIHSREYKNPLKFQNMKTLVVGMGNTGAEIALDLANHNVDIDLSVRSIVNIAPRDLFGRPSQKSAKLLDKLPFEWGDKIGTFVKNKAIGDLSKYGLETSKSSVVKQLKETGKTAVLDLGTVKKIKQGKIKIKKGIKSIDGTTVKFLDNSTKKYDKLILATGYLSNIHDFFTNINSQLNKDQVPKSWKGTGEFSNVYFCGFDNYKLGGILGTIYTDSIKIAKEI